MNGTRLLVAAESGEASVGDVCRHVSRWYRSSSVIYFSACCSYKMDFYPHLGNIFDGAVNKCFVLNTVLLKPEDKWGLGIIKFGARESSSF